MSGGAERLELLIPPRRISRRIETLARRIDADYRGARINLVVVLKGAFVFAADLARRLATPLTIDFVNAASYGAEIAPRGEPALLGVDRLDVAGRHVLLVEDILDTGHTASAIVDALRPRYPASVKVCALLRKPGAAAVDLQPAYLGFEIPADFVVGYGMDYAQRYRKLPGIHRLVLDGGS